MVKSPDGDIPFIKITTCVLQEDTIVAFLFIIYIVYVAY